MLNQDAFQPTKRFSGLADVYARYRPGYPEAALDLIIERGGLGPQSLLVDIGSGTGISSRLFALRGVQVIGIEPNAEMRARAAAEPVPSSKPVPEYRDGNAETTGLSEGCADAVLAAQAFHWFHAKEALREFHRILKPHGWAALMWNERDERDPGTAAFGEVMRTGPDAARIEGQRTQAGEPLLASPYFQDGERIISYHQQQLDEEGVLGRAFSASYAPKDPQARELFAARLRDVFARHERDGQMGLHYETTVFLARRRETYVPMPYILP